MLPDEDEYISLLNVEEVRRKIQKFEALDLAMTSEEIISSTLLKIFSVNRNGESFFLFYPVILTVPENTRFYRVRKDIGFLSGAEKEDHWDNPYAPQNRFNRCGERVLYVSTNILMAINETGVVNGDDFVLIEYSAIQPLEISASVVENRYGDMNSVHEALKLMNDFMIKVAKTPISRSEKFKYKATNALADIINCFPHDEENNRDGMQYVSAYTGEMENLVIKGDHLNKLVMKNAWVVRKGPGQQADFYKQIVIDEDEGTVRFVPPKLQMIECLGKIILKVRTKKYQFITSFEVRGWHLYDEVYRARKQKRPFRVFFHGKER